MSTLGRLILGLLFIGPAFYIGYLALHPLNMILLGVGVSLLLMGALIIDADPVGVALGKVMPFLPFVPKS